MKEELDDIKLILTEIKTDLKYHIKRTDLLEEAFRPVQKHVNFVNGFGKFLVITAAVTTAVVSIVALIVN